MTPASLKHERIPELSALTGIRFFAASSVFLGHIAKIPGMEWALNFNCFNLGTFGVAVFFVLSGFILTYNYARVFEGGVRIRSYGCFVWDRLSKVYPLYLFTLLLCIPIQLVGNHRDWSWKALALHLTLTQCDYPGLRLRLTDYFNVPGWSISCEMLFYLLAPVLIWGGQRFKRWQQILLPVAILWPLSLFVLGKCSENFIWPARFAPLRVPEFCLGVATAVCFVRFKASNFWNRICIGMGLLLIGTGVACDPLVPYFLAGGPLIAPGAAFFIFGLAAGQGALARLLSHRWSVLLGASSFAFYLIHDPIIRICKGVFQHFQFSLTSHWLGLAFGTTLFVILQALSIWIFQHVEMPIQKRMRSLIRKKIPASRPPTQVANHAPINLKVS